MNKCKALFLHSYSKVLMVAVILACLMSSCAYGPEHGKMALADNPFSKEFRANSENRLEEDPDDFTTSDLRFKEERLTLTHESRCMMNCQAVDAFEIQEVLDQDKENIGESSDLVSSGECPRQAYDGTTRDSQEIRIVVAVCEGDPKIVEIIDLNDRKDCDCE